MASEDRIVVRREVAGLLVADERQAVAIPERFIERLRGHLMSDAPRVEVRHPYEGHSGAPQITRASMKWEDLQPGTYAIVRVGPLSEFRPASPDA